MLYLTRKVGESIVVNDGIEITVVEVRGRAVKLGFVFPPGVTVLRRELHDRIKAERAAQGLLGGGNGAESGPDSATVHGQPSD